ncbi:MAG: dihydroorotate dehydrogenase electron transfer subunit [Clostridia bacterium]|nr:dihydroorotate dehydrogenase electron transfer subunit [Clostridia bacterium]
MNTYTVEVIKNECICRDTYEMVLTTPGGFFEGFKPGQFVHLEIPNRNELILRRPISVHKANETEITLIYKVLGKGTEQLSTLKLHDKINILGPIGTGFPLLQEFESIALIGGGLGCAPLLSVPAFDSAREYHAFLGFSDKEAMYKTSEMELLCEDCHVATDDGSFGYKGNTVQLFKEYLDNGGKADAVFACGPVPMMKGLKQLNLDIPLYLSLEERMGCGYGACLTCVCNGNKGFKRVCVDGPVFAAEEVEL